MKINLISVTLHLINFKAIIFITFKVALILILNFILKN